MFILKAIIFYRNANKNELLQAQQFGTRVVWDGKYWYSMNVIGFVNMDSLHNNNQINP